MFTHEPCAPTAFDLECLESLASPIVYLDWNVMQILRKEPTGAPLLQALLEGRSANRFHVPHTMAHVQDAAALWHSEGATDARADRLRNITFADGLTAGVLWTIDDESEAYRVERDFLWDVCERAGMFTSRDAERARGDDPLSELVDTAIRERARAVAAEIRGAQNVDPALRETMASALERWLGDGMWNASDTGAAFGAMFGPVSAYVLDHLPTQRARRVHPREAVPVLTDALRAVPPHRTFLEWVDAVASGEGLGQARKAHRDAVGPSLLGNFGFYPDKPKALRQGSPGAFVDVTHQRFAMAAGLVITTDERMAMRLEAWAYATERGLAHRTSPVVSLVNQTSPESFLRTADLVSRIGDFINGSLASDPD